MITNWCMLLGLLIYLNVGVKLASSMPMAIARENNDVFYGTQDGTVFTDLNQQNEGSGKGDEYVEEEVIEYVPVQKKKSNENPAKGLIRQVGRFFANEPSQQASADPFVGVSADNKWSLPTTLFKKTLVDGAQELSKKLDTFYADDTVENNDQDYNAELNRMFGEPNLSTEGQAPAKAYPTSSPSTGLAGGEDYGDYLNKLMNEEETPAPQQEAPNGTILARLPSAIKRVPSTLSHLVSNVGKLNNKGSAENQDFLNLSPTFDPNAQNGAMGIDNDASDQLNLEVRADPQSGAGPGGSTNLADPFEELKNAISRRNNPDNAKGPTTPAANKPNQNDLPPPPETRFPINNPKPNPKPPAQIPAAPQPSQKTDPSKASPINPDDPFQPANAPSQPAPLTTPAKPSNQPPPAVKPPAKNPEIDPDKVFQPTATAPQPTTAPNAATPSTPATRSPSKQEPPPANQEDPFGVDPFAGIFEDPNSNPVAPPGTSPSTPKKTDNVPTQQPVKPASPGRQSLKPPVETKAKPDLSNPNDPFEQIPANNSPNKVGTSPSSPKPENPGQQPSKTSPTTPTLNLPSNPSRLKTPSTTQEPSASKPNTPTVNPNDIFVPVGEPIPTQSKKPPPSELTPVSRPQLPRSATMPPLRTPPDQAPQSVPAIPKTRAPDSQTSNPPTAAKPLPTSPSRPKRMSSKPITFSDEDENVSVPVGIIPETAQKMSRPPPRSTVPDPNRLLSPGQSIKPQRQPSQDDALSNTPLRLKPTTSKKSGDTDADDELVNIPISRLGVPQKPQGFWARYFGIKWVPLAEVLVPGSLDPMRKVTGLVGRWARYIAGAFSLAGFG